MFYKKLHFPYLRLPDPFPKIPAAPDPSFSIRFPLPARLPGFRKDDIPPYPPLLFSRLLRHLQRALPTFRTSDL